MKFPADTIQKLTEEPKPDIKKTDNGKKEVKKSEDASQKDDEVKSGAASKGSENEKSDDDWTWTSEQDALILKLKGENVSWKEIAIRMSLAKSDIQVRFKELQKKAAEALAANTTDNRENKDGEESNGKDGQNDEKSSEGKKKEDGDGNGGRLRPDDNWRREDCEILEMLEARYREQKWLSMQASFYNITGKMIRADIIERKLSEARP